jgi:hypothetical protein
MFADVSDDSLVSNIIVKDAHRWIKYRYRNLQPCKLPCCTKIVKKSSECPHLDCHAWDNDNSDTHNKPWFVRSIVKMPGKDQWTCSAGDPIFRDSEVCECDTTKTSTKRTCHKLDAQNNKLKINDRDTWWQDEIVSASNKRCEYLRKTYINYNDILDLNNVALKRDRDNYYCCSAELEDYLYQNWAEWDECTANDKPGPNAIDPNDCKCTANGDGVGCGIQTRRRKLKCADFKIDDTVCPCVETRKCDIPKCPQVTGCPGLTGCNFNPQLNLFRSWLYQVNQCESIRGSSYSPDKQWQSANTNALVQFNTKTAAATCPGFCKCDDMIKASRAGSCPAFDTDCDKLIWAGWSTCDNFDEGKCGDGTQFRYRKCGNNDFEKTKTNCYDPHVKRTFKAGEVLEMENNPEYYEKRDCHKECPNFTPWTGCSVTVGKGVQMRLEVGTVAENEEPKYEFRVCDGSGVVPNKKTGKSEPIYTKCNADCGMGTRYVIVHDYDTGRTSRTAEVCKAKVPCATEYFQCPLIPIQDLYKDMERNKLLPDTL